MEDERQPRIGNRPKARWYHYAGDFFNTLKAFIGTNYLALAFAFKQSGLILGIIGVFFIACLTDHCCQLMVRTKYFVIEILMEEERAKGTHTPQQLQTYRAKLDRSIGYGDLGRIAFGKGCAYVIDFAVWFTQMLCLVAYFIFLANTIYSLFPERPAAIPLNNSIPMFGDDEDGNLCPVDSPSGYFYQPRTDIGIPMLNIPNLNKDRDECQSIIEGQRHKRAAENHMIFHGLNHQKWAGDNSQVMFMDTENLGQANDNSNTTAAPIATNMTLNATTSEPNTMVVGLNTTTAGSNTTTVSPYTKTPAPTPFFYLKSIAPDMKLLFLIPLPFFLCTSLIRELRILSPLTVVATFALFIGAFSVLGFEISGFSVAEGIHYYKLQTLPVFLGQLIGAYEGIGCILPIESSMEGNRWAFPMMLHGSVYIVFAILTAFGSIGYLRYGESVKQLITMSITQHTPLSIAIDATLIVSVLFTYPLQCFPVITITENYLLSPGGLCGPRVQGLPDGDYDDEESIQNNERQGLLESTSSVQSEHSDVAVVVPRTIPAWKRNVVRVLITLVAMGLGIALWDAYAYVGAVSGALGASLLAYILPCLIHLKIKGRAMRLRLIIKDLVIIFLAVVASILTLVVIIGEIATGKLK